MVEIIAGNKDFIKEAFRFRKAWGGGTRQLGVLAAAGMYALKNNISRLADDHANASLLAKKLPTCLNLRLIHKGRDKYSHFQTQQKIACGNNFRM